MVVADRVRLLDLRGRGQYEYAARVARQRAGEEDVVDRSLRLGDGGDRVERRQVQERRHVAALQVEVDERDVRPGQGGEREGQVDGQRGGAEATARAAHRDDGAGRLPPCRALEGGLGELDERLVELLGIERQGEE